MRTTRGAVRQETLATTPSKKTPRLIWLLLLILLIGCVSRQEVNFNTDPRILRGLWEGTLYDYPEPGELRELSFELESTYIDRTSYAFSGHVWLDEDETLDIEGVAYGRQTEIYTRSTWFPPPRIAGFTASIPELALHICANGGRDIKTYYGWAFPEDTPPASRPNCSGCQSSLCLSEPINFSMRRATP